MASAALSLADLALGFAATSASEGFMTLRRHSLQTGIGAGLPLSALP